MPTGSCCDGVDNKTVLSYNHIMTNVIISTASVAAAAAVWCMDNLDQERWSMELMSFRNPGASYRFSFDDSETATYIALKYA